MTITDLELIKSGVVDRQRKAWYYQLHEPVDGDYDQLKVTLFYDLGGYNYFTGGKSPRGYYVSVKPVRVAGMMESFTMFSGGKVLVEEATRFSAKRFAELDEDALDAIAPYTSEFIKEAVMA